MHDPFDIPADLDTPVSAFLKLRPLQPRFLLESVEGGQRLGRYSFIGFGEAEEISIDSSDPGGREETLARLRSALESAPHPGRGIPGVPLPGGLVGACSYDLVRRFERLPAHTRARSGEPDAVFVAPRSLLVFDHLSRRAALLHDGDASARAALRREVTRVLSGPLQRGGSQVRVGTARPSLTRDDFLGRVERVKEEIASGEVYQLVLAIRFAAEFEGDPFQVYRALRLLNPSPYMFYLDVGGSQIVGSSPEALVKLSGRTAELRPIAGTRPRGADEESDLALEKELLADPKEAAEHVMLVDMARNDLGRVAATGSVTVKPYRAIERYSHVMHIVSGVRGVLAPQYDAFDLFASAFPAGTVTGAPKIRAMELIDELEPVRRGFYAGTVGYFGHGGAMDQAITIRTLAVRNGEVSYQAGAGIVADSIPEREHEEIRAKSAALAAALNLAGEGLE